MAPLARLQENAPAIREYGNIVHRQTTDREGSRLARAEGVDHDRVSVTGWTIASTDLPSGRND